MILRSFFFKNRRNCKILPILTRNLFTEESLGLKSMEKWAEERRKICGIRADELRSRLDRYLTPASTENTQKFIILTDDIKNAIASALASNDKKSAELPRILELCQKYHQQTKSWRISSFPVGPTLMKLCYKFKQPDLALKLMMLKNQQKQEDQEMMSDFFDNLSSYQLCMDLFYESKRYDDVMKTWEQFQGGTTISCVKDTIPYPRSLLILVFASLHEMNTKESTDYAINLYKAIRNSNFPVPRRALMFFVSLCQKQNQPEIAYELLTTINADEFVLGRSLKIQLLCKLRREPEILYSLRKLIFCDLSTENYEDNEISADILPDLRNLFQENNIVDKQMGTTVVDDDHESYRQKFDEILKLLRQGRHLTNVSIDRLLKAPIAISPSSTETLNELLHAEKSNFDALPQQKIETTSSLLPGFDALSEQKSENPSSFLPDFDALSVQKHNKRLKNASKSSSLLNALPVSDLADMKKSSSNTLSYTNETGTDLDDVKMFSRAEERHKRRERVARALAQKIAADGPFQK